MPFKSVAQEHFLFAKHPDIAHKFAQLTPPGAKLPEHAGQSAGSQIPGLSSKAQPKGFSSYQGLLKGLK